MVSLKTTYMGIALKNPIIIGANNMMADFEKVKKIEEAGAAAVVYKSLFEEQIELESLQMEEQIEEYTERHAEMISIFPEFKHSGPKEHLFKLKKLKSILKIPVIASLNAVSKDTWIDYAKKIEETGVDGIELNFYSVPSSIKKASSEIEKEQLDILQSINKEISIPFSVKLSYFYSNTLNVIYRMDKEGVKGFVLFNKLFQPQINIDDEKYVYPITLSCEHENKIPIRWTGLAFGNINADICSSTGIYNGSDVIKMILSGASCTQSVSTIYRNGIDHIPKMINEIQTWMDLKGYREISDFKGKLSKKNMKDPYFYERAQYVDILISNEVIIKKAFTR
ncbi:MAG: dihydroorotate dehydrogenase-like protein [Actinobacteria bacterium]|nr:dihydroorotate dehydrogenase-like protein [Actinomycetota bacterium]